MMIFVLECMEEAVPIKLTFKSVTGDFRSQTLTLHWKSMEPPQQMTTLGKWLPVSHGDTLADDLHTPARLAAGILPADACNAAAHCLSRVAAACIINE